MASRMSRRVLRAKQPVSRSDSSEVVFIQTGSLKIFRQGGKDASIEVALLGPDDIFGLVEMMGFFEATRWAVAQTASEVFVISMSIARELSVADARTSVETLANFRTLELRRIEVVLADLWTTVPLWSKSGYFSFADPFETEDVGRMVE